MAYPMVEIEDKSVFVLNGFERFMLSEDTPGDRVVVRDKASLIDATKNNRQAVALVYLYGRGLPAA